MKLVKNFVFAVLLVFALAFNAFAGDVDTPGAPAPPRMSVSDDDLPLGTGTDTEPTDVETSESLFYEALAALLSVY